MLVLQLSITKSNAVIPGAVAVGEAEITREGVGVTAPGCGLPSGVWVGKIVPVAVIGAGRTIGVAVNTDGVRVAGGVYPGSGKGWTVQPLHADAASARKPAAKRSFLILSRVS